MLLEFESDDGLDVIIDSTDIVAMVARRRALMPHCIEVTIRGNPNPIDLEYDLTYFAMWREAAEVDDARKRQDDGHENDSAGPTDDPSGRVA